MLFCFDIATVDQFKFAVCLRRSLLTKRFNIRDSFNYSKYYYIIIQIDNTERTFTYTYTNM